MRQIGTIEQESLAERFSAYLITQQIDNRMDPHGGRIEVWIKDEDQLQRARDELETFLQHPDDPKYLAAIRQAEALRREQLQKQIEHQKRVIRVAPGPPKRNQPLTLLLIGISVLVALATNFGNEQVVLRSSVFQALAFNSMRGPEVGALLAANNGDLDAWNVRLASVNRGQIWRLLTPIFLHFSVLHLLFNMVWLYQLGGRIEDRYGTVRFGLLVVAAGAISNLAQCLAPYDWDGAQPFIYGAGDSQGLIAMLGGMSGIVYALFGFLWMKSTFDPGSRIYMPPSTVMIMIGWLVFCMVPGSEQLIGARVANWAHAVGLVVGMIFGYWSTLVPRRP